MKRKSFYAAASFALFLTACSPSAPKKAAEITKLETEILESSKKNIADTAKVKQVMADYRYYADKFPTDSLSPVYIMKLAKLYAAVQMNDSAIYFYDKVYRNYPSSPKVSMALFSEAFIYNNEKHNIAKAGELYKEYLAKFPNTVLAKSAEMELQNLGKTPEQILNQMDSLRKTKADTTATK